MKSSSQSQARRLKLGLIGGNIRQSRAPELHRLCGELTGIEVTYDLIIPADLGKDFDAAFEQCRSSGLRGVNVTYPYKEHAAAMVTIPDRHVRQIGSVNTVVFEEPGPKGHNTDYSGFIAGYRSVFGDMPPGVVTLVGAGGVGRAIAFGLVSLGARGLHLVDREATKVDSLTEALQAAVNGSVAVEIFGDVADAVRGADGIVNATPLGMTGYPGTAVPLSLLGGQSWAFDAVYTPVETVFIQGARSAGLSILSGYELFFFQGVHAFELFAGTRPDDLGELRRLLNTSISAGM